VGSSARVGRLILIWGFVPCVVFGLRADGSSCMTISELAGASLREERSHCMLPHMQCGHLT